MKRTLSHILTSEGRVVCDDDGNFDYYEYNLKDHLGNTRVVFTEDDGVIKNNDYYPFGMLMGGTDAQPVDGDNKFLYNGKEYINNTDLNLSWYDYGRRMYDPQLGRWHSVDPLAENYWDITPYNYVMNDPILFIDPNGMGPFKNLWKKVKHLYHRLHPRFTSTGHRKVDVNKTTKSNTFVYNSSVQPAYTTTSPGGSDIVLLYNRFTYNDFHSGKTNLSSWIGKPNLKLDFIGFRGLVTNGSPFSFSGAGGQMYCSVDGKPLIIDPMGYSASPLRLPTDRSPLFIAYFKLRASATGTNRINFAFYYQAIVRALSTSNPLYRMIELQSSVSDRRYYFYTPWRPWRKDTLSPWKGGRLWWERRYRTQYRDAKSKADIKLFKP